MNDTKPLGRILRRVAYLVPAHRNTTDGACGYSSLSLPTLEYLVQSDKTPTPPTLLRASCLPIFLPLKVLLLQQPSLQ